MSSDQLNGSSGFQELEHTADWALKVWSPDLPQLFIQAALGMNSLSGLVISSESPQERILHLSGLDEEDLLVRFLEEILYYGESEGLGFFDFHLELKNLDLVASAQAGKILSQEKEIKAVTFHNLVLEKIPGRYEITIVFDV